MKPLKILVACEESQVVTKAMRQHGHEAYSCDLLPTSGGNPEWHIKEDCRLIMDPRHGWDMVIAFPPCTYLAVSGARWNTGSRLSDQTTAIFFFLSFTTLPMPWAIENPIGIMSSRYRKPDQIIQPWQFGHGETKATCLWLHRLPPLKPTKIVAGREARIHKMAPSPERSKLRSKTYSGIASAMANQWTPALP